MNIDDRIKELYGEIAALKAQKAIKPWGEISNSIDEHLHEIYGNDEEAKKCMKQIITRLISRAYNIPSIRTLDNDHKDYVLKFIHCTAAFLAIAHLSNCKNESCNIGEK